MTHPLTLSTAFMLVLAPLLWAGNAVVGRILHELVPPITLNFLRWAIAMLILLPLAYASVQLMRWWGRLIALSQRPDFKRADA